MKDQKIMEVACPECKGSGKMPDVTDQGRPRPGVCWRCKGERVVKFTRHSISVVKFAPGEEGVYVDGVLRMEGSHVDIPVLLAIIGWKTADLMALAGISYKEEMVPQRESLPVKYGDLTEIRSRDFCCTVAGIEV